MKNRGFTLIEMMIAIFVMVVGMMGVLSLLQRVIFSGSLSSSRLVAAYLAQEGLEIVRNVRDTNWLEARSAANDWDEGINLACGGAGFIVDYKHSYGPSQIDPSFPCYSGQYLNTDANGFYSYSSGTQTKFKRTIKVSSPDSAIRNVAVEVIWTDGGASYSLSVQENLYNWR
jgi:prepilin-type N-terminal cleavage/methylation domain-containing protein